MEPSVLNRPLAIVIVLALVIGGAGIAAKLYFSDEAQQAASAEALKNATVEGAQSDEDKLDQTLKTINLSQGEGGFEIWRLKAEWANVMQQGERIIVDNPRLTYLSKTGDATPLYVNSQRGDVVQKSQILRFIDNVRIMQDDKVMKGDLLIYNGTAKTMTFPDGGHFTDTGMQGDAAHIVWALDQKTIVGEGGVHVFFEKKTPENPASSSNSTNAK